MTAQATQTEQTTTEAPKPQPTHHYVLTLQHQQSRGELYLITFNAAVTPPKGWSRCDFFRRLYSEFTTGENAHLAGAQVLFFSFERNQL